MSAPIKKRRFTPKQQKLIKAIPSADTQKEAGEIAGYKHPESTHRALQAIKERMPDVMDRIGLSDEAVLNNHLKPLLDATKKERVHFMGSLTATYTDPDNSTRMQALNAWARLKGHGGRDDNESGGGGRAPIFLNLEFLSPERAKEVLVSVGISIPTGGDKPSC